MTNKRRNLNWSGWVTANPVCQIRKPNMAVGARMGIAFVGVCLIGLGPTESPLARFGIHSAAGSDQRAAAESTAEFAIARLIEQLGADQFVVRERAQDELRGLGLLAFDQLLRASHHDDVEISLRARYLVRSMPVQWTTSGDPAEVRSILRNYGTSGRAERRNRMQQLTALPDSQGILPLCRLARFEIDMSLSKEAALFVMNSPASTDAESYGELAEQIARDIGSSQRTASRWLRTYSRSLSEPTQTLEEWLQITQAEQQTLAQFPDRTGRYIVRDLFRWHADLLRQLGRSEEFITAVRSSLELVEGRLAELYDAVDWASEREAWAVVDEVAHRFDTEFNRHAILVYRLAESQLRRGDAELADQTAARALAIEPESLEDHLILADRLHSRLLYEWAENEYRFVIASTEPSKNDGLHMEARFYLADMLVDLEQELAAAKLLKEAIEVIKEDESLLAPSQKTLAEVESSMHYYLALDYGRKGDTEKQMEHLETAYLRHAENPDILIGMFHVSVADAAWQETTRQRIEISKQSMRERVAAAENTVQNPKNEPDRLRGMLRLAQALNELAWLTSNTSGDFSEAVRFSQRSLQLRPGSPAYLDTLGRCFFAAGDIKSAVTYQRQAVERAPRYQQIRRQLKTFEEALEASDESD